jgi:hypothetical protein
VELIKAIGGYEGLKGLGGARRSREGVGGVEWLEAPRKYEGLGGSL